MKLLRRYERTAQDYHDCCYCNRQIEPGDMYKGEVFLNENRKDHRISVFKEHIHPKRDSDPEDFETDFDEFEEKAILTLEKKIEKPLSPLKKAA